MFAGQELPPGSRPIAQAYAGHQYGHFTMLGDGRAILLGEHRAPDGRLVDVQFKGSGRTRFSRGGDGLAALGPMLREYVVSEAMAALGVPTTRSLAVVTTGEPVYRDGARRGAVLTRVAASHLRVGTFEYAAALQDEPTLRALADYAIARHYPELARATGKYLAFFRAVAGRQAAPSNSTTPRVCECGTARREGTPGGAGECYTNELPVREKVTVRPKAP